MIKSMPLYAVTGANILDGGEFGDDRAGLLCWTEIPDVFFIHGRVGTVLDEQVARKVYPLD